MLLSSLFVATSACAMIRTLPFPDLVQSAYVIVIAKVIEKVSGPKSKHGYHQIKNILMPEKVLKGDLTIHETFEILTPNTKGKWREDMVTFPDKGCRVILFLKKRTSEGPFNIVNGIQGLWPLQDGSNKTLGMGFRYSIGDVEKELRSNIHSM
ncbi:MAG: hypothetical protein PHI97_26655 [Desulfobulbus sp.]|nr:hypothetical protein [Desulfobulbus sp.]